MSDLAIRIEDLSKLYRLGAVIGGNTPRQNYRTLSETVGTTIAAGLRRVTGRPAAEARKLAQRSEDELIWARKDVSCSVHQGQVIGVSGRNGAGKSTLLKILSRITEPTTGYAEVHGRVGSLLEVGTGFHPELTGRENIYLNGAILGMRRQEIDRKFDEIVDFSGVEKFIDTPVKRYSSGMYLRLAFAVAAHLEPEILVVDEVLAVGDAEFQRKCLGKMSDVAHEGRTILFVSHNMSAILNLTEETVVLDKGRLAYRAATGAAVDFYMSSGLAQVSERVWSLEEIPAEAAPFRPLAIRLRNRYGQISDTIRSTEPAQIEVEYGLDLPITGLREGLYLITARGEYVLASFDTDEQEQYEQFAVRPAGHYISRCTLPVDLLNEGRYILGVNASSYRIRRYFQDESALSFNVDASGAPGSQWPEARLGPVRPRLAWEIEGEAAVSAGAEAKPAPVERSANAPER